VSYMQSLKNKIDWNLFEKIRNKHMKENYNRIGPLKYFNYKEYLRLNVRRAIDLKLHSCAPKRILDVGCGFGYFMFVCNNLGHEIEGLDFIEGNDPDTKCYPDMVKLFGQQRRLYKIQRYKLLPSFEEKFDLITAFQICFACHNSPQRWKKEEWGFFLNDIKSHLNPGGQVYLDFNMEQSTQRFHSDQLKEYFIKRGARLLKDDQVVFFDSGVLESGK
jgi:SAM-dependent methyltransferase